MYKYFRRILQHFDTLRLIIISFYAISNAYYLGNFVYYKNNLSIKLNQPIALFIFIIQIRHFKSSVPLSDDRYQRVRRNDPSLTPSLERETRRTSLYFECAVNYIGP